MILSASKRPCLSLLQRQHHQVVIRMTNSTRRFLGTKASQLIGSNPLDLLQKECFGRGFCDNTGKRVQGVDWRFIIAMGGGNDRPPNLRTLNIAQLTSEGIDFVVKEGSSAATALENGTKVSFLHTQGQFLPGQSAEQWRGEGQCVTLDLKEIIHLVPPFTVTSLVGSRRLLKGKQEQEEAAISSKNTADEHLVSAERAAVGTSKSHLVEVIQRTKYQLENGEIEMDELATCIHAFRLKPLRVECMLAGPDSSVMWDRWEWLRESHLDEWKDPKQLVPH